MQLKTDSPKKIMGYIFTGIVWGFVSKIFGVMMSIALFSGSGYDSGYGEGNFFLFLSSICSFIAGIYIVIGLYEALKLILVAQNKILKGDEIEEVVKENEEKLELTDSKKVSKETIREENEIKEENKLKKENDGNLDNK